MDSSKKFKKWQSSLNLINSCPICKSKYNTKTHKKYLEGDSVNLMHITCHICQTYFVAIFMEIMRGVSTIGMVTDLNFEDVNRLFHRDAISLDEALDGVDLINKAKIEKYLIK